MPEERGLYQDITLERCILYLASLKGLSRNQARERSTELLKHFDLYRHRTKKVKELSKGMQQKAQIICTVIHRPDLIIIDEPYTGLDPINTQLVKDLMCQLRDEGATIIMSTHQMHQVEELCDRILLINNGRDVLYGDLEKIRRQYAGHAVLIRATGDLPAVPGIENVTENHNSVRWSLSDGVSPQDVLKQLVDAGVQVEKFEIAVPSVSEIFIRVVEGEFVHE